MNKIYKHLSLFAASILIGVAGTNHTQAQTAFTVTNEGTGTAFAYNSAGTTCAPITLNSDDVVSSVISFPMSLTFEFNGVCYSSFRATSNGQLLMDAATTFNAGQSYQNNGASGLSQSTMRTIIASMWDDFRVNPTDGNVNYQVYNPNASGSADGDEYMVVEWYKMNWCYNNTGTVALSFQTTLYFSNHLTMANNIRFHYKQEAGYASRTSTGSTCNPGSSIGVSGVALNTFVSITMTPFATSTASEDKTNSTVTDNQRFLLVPSSISAGANDSCGSATTLSVITTCAVTPTNGSTVGATPSPQTFGGACSSGNIDDVWFTFTTPASGGPYAISTDYPTSGGCSGSITTNIEVYSGSCASPTYFNCDNNSSVGTTNNGYIASAALAANTQYWVRVDGDGNNEGAFQIAVYDNSFSTIGNTCATPNTTTIGTINHNQDFHATGNTDCSLDDYASYFGGVAVSGEDVVYKFSTGASGGGLYNINVVQTAGPFINGGGNYEHVAWYVTDNNCPPSSSTSIGSEPPDIYSAFGSGSIIDSSYRASGDITLSNSTTYYLYLDSEAPIGDYAYRLDIDTINPGWGTGSRGHLPLNAIYATNLSSPQTISSSTCRKGNEIYALTSGQVLYDTGEDCWIKLDSSSITSATYIFTLTNTNPVGGTFDNTRYVGFHLYSGSTVPTTTAGAIGGVTYVGSSASGAGSSCALTVNLTNGTTYWIMVDSWAYPRCFNFNLEIDPPPSTICNSSYYDSVTSVTSYTHTGTVKRSYTGGAQATWGHTLPVGSVACTGTQTPYYLAVPDTGMWTKVYKIPGAQITTTGTYYINLVNNTGDKYICWGVYTACTPPPSSCVGSMASGSASNVACGSVSLTAGTTYWVHVGFYTTDNDPQNYTLTIQNTPICTNNFPSAAVAITLPYSNIINNICAVAHSDSANDEEPGVPGSHLYGHNGAAVWQTTTNGSTWYTFTAPASGSILFVADTSTSTPAPQLTIVGAGLYHLPSGATLKNLNVRSFTPLNSTSSGTLTVNTHGPHTLSVGDSISLMGLYTSVATSRNADGNYSVASIPTDSTFTIAMDRPWYTYTAGGTHYWDRVSTLLYDAGTSGNFCEWTSGVEAHQRFDNLNAGQTYYLRVAGLNAQGYTRISVQDASNVSYIEGKDCKAPILICSQSATYVPSSLDYGNYCDQTRFLSTVSTTTMGERGGLWFKFKTVAAGGTLRFTATPMTTVLSSNVQMSFELYDITSLNSNASCANNCFCDSILAQAVDSVSTTHSPNLSPLDTIRGRYGSYPFGGCQSVGINSTAPGSCSSVSNTATANASFSTDLTDAPSASGNTYLLHIGLAAKHDSTHWAGVTLDFSPSTPNSGSYLVDTDPTSLTWTGLAYNTDWFDPKNWGGCVIPTCDKDATIPVIDTNYVSYPIIADTGSICKRLQIASGASLEIAAGYDLKVCGNLINNGTFTQNAGTSVELKGTTTQYLGGSAGAFAGANSFRKLIINNTFGTSPQVNCVTLLSSTARICVIDTLQMSDGVMRLNTNQRLVLGATGNAGTIISDGVAAPNTYTTSYLWGTIRRFIPATGTYEFPVGNTSVLERATMTVTALGSTPLDSLDVKFSSGSLTGVGVGADTLGLRYDALKPDSLVGILECGATAADNTPGLAGIWTFTPYPTGANTVHDMELYAKNFSSTQLDSGRTVVRRDNSSDNWDYGTSTAVSPYGTNASPYYIATGDLSRAKRTGFTGFSEFAEAFGMDPLPLQLVEFTGKNMAKGKNLLNWTTSTETNTDFFILERSGDGNIYHALGTVQAKGPSSGPLDYSYVDDSPINGNNYYRLRIVQDNNKELLSNVVLINNSTEEFALRNLYPNPTMSVINMDVLVPQAGAVSVQLVDVIGNYHMSQNQNLEKGIQVIQADVSKLAAGVYFVKVVYSDEFGKSKAVTSRFVKL